MKENVILALSLLLFVMVGSLLFKGVSQQFGSVSVTNEYQATTTAAGTAYGSTITGDSLVKRGLGTFGSLVITGAATGVINFYDATTTNVNSRTGNKATSTIHIASIPASLAAGTYVFDHEFTDGLFLDLDSGTMPTTTITYR